MRAVDTNILVRIVRRDDARQAEAADQWVARGAWVPLPALVEMAWVLSAVYERTAVEVAAAIEMLLNHEHLTLQDADAVGAALVHFRRRPALGFSDCLLLEIARKAGHLPLGTFGAALARLEGAERIV